MQSRLESVHFNYKIKCMRVLEALQALPTLSDLGAVGVIIPMNHRAEHTSVARVMSLDHQANWFGSAAKSQPTAQTKTRSITAFFCSSV